MKKVPIIAGNWKMNKLPSEGRSFINEVVNLVLDIKSVSVIFAPPFTGLFEVQVKSPFHIAAQNCHWEDSGALTGEISVSMIKDCGVEYVIVGHSERRHIFGEKNEWVNKKAKALLENGVSPILCVGETIAQRESGETESVLKDQLEKGLDSISDVRNCIIAYEPVWAIGTGLTATNEQVEIAHQFIREVIGNKYGNGDGTHILYGGSVNSGNAESLIQTEGVDGFLIGGASLDAGSFASIIKIVEEVQES
tara:strand:+ start:2025 stop:2777 length:753 start_codon:yes stop_codon:yes gene_type:complete